MSEFQSSNFKKQNGGTPNLVGKTDLTSPYFFVPPSGDTASRPANCAAGTLRFNTDVGTLEVYRGDGIGWEFIQKREGQYLGGNVNFTNSAISNYGTGTRALMAGGDTPSLLDHIDFITIPTMGDATDFGDLSTARAGSACISSRTTIAWCGGYAPGISNSIDTTIFSSTGTAVDTANLTANKQGCGKGPGNNTRGLIKGGNSPSATNVIEFYTFETAGDAKDFGDLSAASITGSGCSSSTRSVMNLGFVSPARVNTIDFVTTSTTGDAVDFGDLTDVRNGTGALSNSTRGVFGGGENPNKTNTIDFVTLATLGNAIDFGDMTYVRSNASGDGASSATRGIFSGGGSPASGNDNSRMKRIDKIEIATTGDAVDFGDMTDHTSNHGVASNGHGGL